MNTSNESEILKIRELQARYAEEGFEVVIDPEPGDLPFDLWGYRPDLLVKKGDTGYLIEVRSSGTRLPVDRFLEIVEEVRRHPGWGFLLVTADDVVREGIPVGNADLPSWDELRERAATAIRLAEAGTGGEPAFLALWATLEGLFRKSAERISLPVERLPSSTLIRHLYSYGALSADQFDSAMDALQVRDRVAHGYRAPELEQATRRLLSLVKELLSDSLRKAA